MTASITLKHGDGGFSEQSRHAISLCCSAHFNDCFDKVRPCGKSNYCNVQVKSEEIIAYFVKIRNSYSIILVDEGS